MRKPEQKLWDELRPEFNKAGHCCRVESHATAIGFPDVDYCLRGVEGSLELKVWTPRTKKPLLRTSQGFWHAKREQAGGNCWTLLQYKWPKQQEIYVLFKGNENRVLLDHKLVSVADTYSFAFAVWRVELDTKELISYLANQYPMRQS